MHEVYIQTAHIYTYSNEINPPVQVIHLRSLRQSIITLLLCEIYLNATSSMQNAVHQMRGMLNTEDLLQMYIP